MRFGAFYEVLMQTGERGTHSTLRVGERGSNGRTWLKQANVEQNVGKTGERGSNGRTWNKTWEKRANVAQTGECGNGKNHIRPSDVRNEIFDAN